MIRPSAEQIAAAKAECRKRFKHERLIGVAVSDPAIGGDMAMVLMADLSFAEASDYHDARHESVVTARSVLLAERLLWPVSGELESIRSEWGAFDVLVEREYRKEVGFTEGSASCRPLAASTCPPGLTGEAASELLKKEAGRRLWSIYSRANGLACVIRQPQPDVWMMGSTLLGDALREHKNTLCPQLQVIADHCVWAPAGGLMAHIEERPGRAEDLNEPWANMGGAAAKTSATRF